MVLCSSSAEWNITTFSSLSNGRAVTQRKQQDSNTKQTAGQEKEKMNQHTVFIVHHLYNGSQYLQHYSPKYYTAYQWYINSQFDYG